ncbi:unnamed protein product [Fraxinus pennsylvanica]|uniref:Uncharacterized protein n=1 Tax=Fraxinus pennsylvanica TaxID=56036 RepID=A0AAD1YN64_9LAMI|nr:unnamed protein product [Fraxinus pennsylvanica]
MKNLDDASVQENKDKDRPLFPPPTATAQLPWTFTAYVFGDCFVPHFPFLVSISDVRYMDLEMVEFKFHDALIASISQIMMKSNGKGIMIVDNLDKNPSCETLYGDSLRLQQVLANFLLMSLHLHRVEASFVLQPT